MMTDRDTEERAAYQRAVALAKDEIARLQADRDWWQRHAHDTLTELHETQAEIAALRARLDTVTQRSDMEQSRLRDQVAKAETERKAWTEIGAKAEADNAAYVEALEHAARMSTIKGARVVINAVLAVDHPGAALLAELTAARAECDKLRAALIAWVNADGTMDFADADEDLAELAKGLRDESTKAK